MSPQQWLEELRSQLIAERVPLHHVERVEQELRDHFEDAANELGDRPLPARLGDPGLVARQSAEAWRQGLWATRFPIITFLVVPLPMLILLWASYTVLGDVILEIVWRANGARRGWIMLAATELIVHFAGLALPSLALAFAWRQLRDSAQPVVWFVLSWVSITLGAATFATETNFVQTPAAPEIFVEVGNFSSLQLLQGSFAAFVGLILVIRQTSSRPGVSARAS